MSREETELDPEVLSDPLEGDDEATVIDIEPEDGSKAALAKAGWTIGVTSEKSEQL